MKHDSHRRDVRLARFFLQMLATRTKPVKKTEIVANWFLNYCIEAWKKRDAQFFEHLARPLKWKNPHGTAQHNLFLHFVELPWEQEQKERQKVYSTDEMKKLCKDSGLSHQQASKLAHAAGLKMRPQGAHGKAWPAVKKMRP
jgi:hypothetical protein